MIDIMLQTVLSNTEIALFNESKKVGYVYKDSLQKSKNTFVYDLYQLLDENDVQWGDVRRVWVVNGPGYFTGIRTGLAIVKAFFDVTNIPIRLVNTFHWLKTGIENLYDPCKIFIPSSAREGYMAFMKENILEEVRSIQIKDLSTQIRTGYNMAFTYTNADYLINSYDLHLIKSFSTLPSIYTEIKRTDQIVPEYIRTEEQLFTRNRKDKIT